MKSVGAPVVIADNRSTTLDRKRIGDTAPFDERWLQELVFHHPDALPMQQIEPGLGRLIPVCMELPLRCGFLDNLYVTPDGDVVIVEVKLWRNHEMRRCVMAQALDYASAVFDMSYEELDAAIRLAEGAGDRSLYQIASSPETLDEPDFIDAVSQNIKSGRIVVLVVGDGIRSELEALNEGLQRHAGFQFTFALVEMAIYEPKPGEYLLVPGTLTKTVRIERGVVRFEGSVDQVRLQAVQSVAQTPITRPQTMTSDAFFAAMSDLDPHLPDQIQALLTELEALGVYPEFKKSLILRWADHDGEVANLAYVHRNGQVWTDLVAYSLKKPNLALTYLETLAKGIGGEIGEIAGRPYLKLNGRAPDIRVLTGKSAVLVEEPGYSTTEIVALRPYLPLCSGYCALALRRPDFVEYVTRLGQGTKMPRLRTEDAVVAPFPLPPLAEQHRIVAKVDELMALLDRLEGARAEREAVRDRLTAATLSRLTAPETDTETAPTEAGTAITSGTATTTLAFQSHARFALQSLPALTTRPDQIKTLRQTILNLAVRGRLVEQDPSDEPAAELLKRIAKEKARLGVKLQREGYDVTDLPFALPSGWAWTPFGNLVLSSDAGWSPKTLDHPRQVGEWGVLKVSAVSWDHFDASANKQVTPGTEPRLQAQVHEGDFLISRANTAELIARAVLVREKPDRLMMSDKIVRLRLAELTSPEYLWAVNNYADFAREHYFSRATGVSPSMKNVSRDVILNLPIPLPPLAEQHRIVAKVDALMALCDQLESSLTTAAATRSRLLDTLIRTALTPDAPAPEAAM